MKILILVLLFSNFQTDKMCDTFIALPSSTKNKSIIFGKNSDREPNEAQAIVRFPRQKNKEKTRLLKYHGDQPRGIHFIISQEGD